MIRWANRILLMMNAILIVFGLLYFGFHGLDLHPNGIEYKDLITIILTAIAVLLASVTIFVALMAIWGYTSIREAAEKSAREVATDVAQTVAAREAQTISRLSGGMAQAPDIKEEDELTRALQAGGPEKGGGNGS